MKEIHRGAEAVIYLDEKGGKIVKKRVSKGYRLRQLDDSLRKSRTRREATVLEKLSSAGMPAPRLLATDRLETIEMEFIDGDKVADILDADSTGLMRQAGEITAVMHDLGIIHGDLTTSNLVVRESKVHILDFGLSFFSEKEEDKAVDIHVLKEALEARHHAIFEEAYESFREGYKKSSSYASVMKRLKKVEARGRYKGK